MLPPHAHLFVPWHFTIHQKQKRQRRVEQFKSYQAVPRMHAEVAYSVVSDKTSDSVVKVGSPTWHRRQTGPSMARIDANRLSCTLYINCIRKNGCSVTAASCLHNVLHGWDARIHICLVWEACRHSVGMPPHAGNANQRSGRSNAAVQKTGSISGKVFFGAWMSGTPDRVRGARGTAQRGGGERWSVRLSCGHRVGKGLSGRTSTRCACRHAHI